ncbi:hypothetical protein BX285_6428 [Streptomyces sp. 1114.5]|uniref:hypothetical protein n=1 Tax=unclassified Streptomyces TaxID=2593676 RepID=UPI000BDB2C5C|nr:MULTISPECIES: hypothetical protein [unclassified Streptomyces]RKT09341.1 hypothetical protein BX285_6428 [Streptomyces sp. 1114.5]SOB88644.1 hypothetical protein SAMN06272789_6933 [Streptomyces sp. 1331.2]
MTSAPQTADAPFVMAGASIETNHNKGEGSLGCFAQDSSGRTVLLSCSHVLFPAFRIIDDLTVYTPKFSRCCSNGVRIGTPVFDRTVKAQSTGNNEWVGGYHDGTWTGGFNWIPAVQASEVDCAMARLNPGVKFHNAWQVDLGGSTTTIPLKGAVTQGDGIVPGPPLGTLPSSQQYVRTYNAVNGRLRFGTMVRNPDATGASPLIFTNTIFDPKTDHKAGIKPNVNQFMILPRPSPVPGQSLNDSYRNGEELAFEEGDSGSMVINQDNMIIAMIIRVAPIDLFVKIDRSAIEFASIGNIAIATPIAKVLSHLKLSIPAADQGWSGTVPSAGSPSPVLLRGPGAVADQARRRTAEDLRTHLRTSVLGRLLLGKIPQHQKEVRRLLTSVRQVTATWHALQGPAFFHHCVRGAELPGHPIPDRINGVSRAQLADGILSLIIQHASPPLRRDLERYGRRIIDALLSVDTLHDVPGALAGRRSGS